MLRMLLDLGRFKNLSRRIWHEEQDLICVAI